MSHNGQRLLLNSLNLLFDFFLQKETIHSSLHNHSHLQSNAINYKFYTWIGLLFCLQSSYHIRRVLHLREIEGHFAALYCTLLYCACTSIHFYWVCLRVARCSHRVRRNVDVSVPKPQPLRPLQLRAKFLEMPKGISLMKIINWSLQIRDVYYVKFVSQSLRKQFSMSTFTKYQIWP